MTPEELTLARRELSRQTVATLVSEFLALDSWRDADADRFLPPALDVLRSGQRTLGQLVALYLAQTVADTLGRFLAPPSIPDRAVVDLRPVPAREVYRRPFATVWSGLARHGDLTRAVSTASARLGSMAELDLQASYSGASRAGMDALPPAVRPRYWRRVLVGSSSCAMCVLVSTRRYSRGDLNPIHPACDCRVQPILPGEPDPFEAQDVALIKRAHAAAEELTGERDSGGRSVDYRRVRTTITADHGEFAPAMLVRPLDEFTGPGDLPAGTERRESATDARRPPATGTEET